ncbi:MFS transporter [Candidatus Neomarinimicrobiota bacterium]
MSLHSVKFVTIMLNRLRQNRNLSLLWVGHMISHSGDAIYQIALPWLILDLTGSKTATSLVALAAYLPAVLFSLFAGVIVDRFSRRGVMIASDLSRMLLVGLLFFYLYTGGTSATVLGFMAFLVATMATPFYPARDALIPDLVAADKLTSANALMSTSGQMAQLSGPALAGFLIAWVGLYNLFAIDAATFAASLAAMLLIRVKDRHRVGPQTATHLSEMLEGLRFVWRESALGLLIILTAINNFFIMGPALIGMPIFVREVLELDFQAFAIIEAHMAAGMIISSVFIWKLGSRIAPPKLLLIGMIVDGLTYSMLYFIDSYPFTRLMLLIHGMGIPMITIPRTTIIQRCVPDNYRGRVFSMVNMSVIGLTALSAAAIGPVAEVLHIKAIFLWIGIFAALCGVVGMAHRGILSLARTGTDR